MVIQEYQDPNVGKYLRYGYWYQAHKPQLRQAGQWALITVATVFWLTALYNGWIFYLSSRDYQSFLGSLAAERAPIEALHQARAPLPLTVGTAAVMSGGADTTADFLADVTNPNPNWYFEADYVFNWSGGQTLSQTAYLLPGAVSAFVTRGVTVNALPTDTTVDFTIRRSRRIQDAAILERIKRIANNLAVSQPRAEREDGATRALYTVSNNSIYDLLSPRFLVIVSQLNTPIAVGMNEVPELPAGASVDLELRWLNSLPAGLTVEVRPLVNVLEAGAYRVPAGRSEF